VNGFKRIRLILCKKIVADAGDLTFTDFLTFADFGNTY